MKIGIPECGRLPDSLSTRLGHYPDMFEALLAPHGFAFDTWHVEGMQFPASVQDADGWLITGSRHGVYEDHAFIPPLEDFIRSARSAQVPMVGICFGHQVMARALGGRVEKFAGGWTVGPQDYDFDTGSLRLNAWHQDQVLDPPPDARTVARNDTCEHAALLYPGWGFSVQAHPEFDDRTVQGLIDERGRGVVPDPLLDRAASSLGHAERDAMGTRIAAFFKRHAADAARKDPT